MPAQMPPTSPEKAPDPSHSYERSHPERESPSGKLTANVPEGTKQKDEPTDAVENKNDGHKAIGSHDTQLPEPEQPDHSMKDEEPLGSDQRPLDISDPEMKRHPRKEGKGGVPDALDR